MTIESFSALCLTQIHKSCVQSYLVENTKEVVWPLGSWIQSGIRTDKGIVAEGFFVNVVKGAYFLISRVFPTES